MARQMHVSVFLLLLLLLFAQLYGTRGILAEQSTGVVRELPRKGQGASQAYTVSTTDRKFIRIHASTEDLTKGKYCSEKEEVIKDFSGKDVNCDGFIFQIYTEEMISTFIKTSIPAAIKLHADRLLVDPVSEPLVVPKFDENNACKNFTVPPEHHSKGVNDADMVLYVAARPVTLFHAVCARNKDGRPIAAGFNIFLSERKSLREEVRLMAHDIAHVLGFDYNVFLEKNMVIESNFEDGKKKRVLVNSTKTKEMVQKHYGCSAADGMELEYERWKTQASSHWNYRVAKDDLMSSRYKHGGAMYYTALTMSVFDDLEYYSANWGMEEPMTWGNKSDCYLLDNNYNDEFVKKYPGMFCVPGAPFSCTSDRTGVGYCDPNAFYTDHDREESRALYIRYEKGTLSHSATRMCNENRSLTLSGSVFADDSLCLDTDVYKTNGKENISYTGVCARVSCDKGKVKVMYAGISEWKECPENKSLEVDRGDSDTPITLKCPKYSEVCTIAPDGSSRLPLVIPPGEKPATPPGTEGNGSNGGGADVGNGNQGGNNNVDNGNQGVDGCIVPAFLAPVLLLVTVLALLLHQ